MGVGACAAAAAIWVLAHVYWRLLDWIMQNAFLLSRLKSVNVLEPAASICVGASVCRLDIGPQANGMLAEDGTKP